MDGKNRAGAWKIAAALLVATMTVVACGGDPAPIYQSPTPAPAAETPPPETVDPNMPPINRPPPPKPVQDEELPPISSAPSAFCGGIAGLTCESGEYCFYEKGNCGIADQGGTCAPTPDKCSLNYQPVCGCDGKTYSNNCGAALNGVSVARSGEC